MQLIQWNTAMIDFSSDETKKLIIMGAVFALIIVLAIVLPWARDFTRELRYIEMEIQRTSGRERAHWEKKKRRLWLSLLPFFHYH